MFESVTVFIEFRFKAGDHLPSSKALRARVIQDGVYGDDLVLQFSCNPASVKRACYRALGRKSLRVLFEFDPMVKIAYPKCSEN